MRFIAAALMLFTLSGCVAWRVESPMPSEPKPIAIATDNAAKTVDLSYTFTGDDERWQAGAYRRLIVTVFEHSGYIVNEVPWSSQPGMGARIRVAVTKESSRGWLYLPEMTLGAIPGYGSFSTSINIAGLSKGKEATHEGTTTARSFVWLPLFWLSFTSQSIIQLQNDGVEEIIKGSIVRLREERILLSP